MRCATRDDEPQVEDAEDRQDSAKISAVTTWPVPDSRKQLQRFLGFTNFYRWFFRGYSAVAAPLTALTSSKVPFLWSTAANDSFQTLKVPFNLGPYPPDATLAFSEAKVWGWRANRMEQFVRNGRQPSASRRSLPGPPHEAPR